MDIGANIGYVSCLLLHNVPNSQVISIEPQPMLTELLHKNLGRFAGERWKVNQAALSDSEGEGFLRIDLANRGGSQLVRVRTNQTISVPMVSAARLFSESSQLDIVKIDIEGHEEVVFRSGFDELMRLHPRAILYEDQKAKSGPTGGIGEILKSLGYAVYGLQKTLVTTRLELVTASNSTAFHDFIAISTRRRISRRAKSRYDL
jgi:FkbM family methyltransferase